MISKGIVLISIFFLMNISNVYSKNITIHILCADEELKSDLKRELNNKYKVVNSIKKADYLVCDRNFLSKCVVTDKKIIAINLYSYEISKIQHKNIIGYFPIDCPLPEFLKFIDKHLKNIKIKCLVSHYKRYNLPEIKFFYVKNIGEVPYVINKALKKCDILIVVPDDIVYNYFSMRFIFKKAILEGKLITGYSEDMIKMGAVYTYEINKLKYVKLIEENFKEILKQKKRIIYPKFKDFNLFENKKILK